MKAKYQIKSQEEGKGRVYTERFTSLAAASAYIQDRWQGIEYRDGNSEFHTDYCSYVLVGFKFSDIGTVIWDPRTQDVYDREFKFTALGDLDIDPSQRKARIVAVVDGGDCYHFRATEAWIEYAKGNWGYHDGEHYGSLLVGVWTDAEYLEHFKKSYAPLDASDSVQETTAEVHARHSDASEHQWCPLCQAEIAKHPQTEGIPF